MQRMRLMDSSKGQITCMPLTNLKKVLRRVRKRESENSNFSLNLSRGERHLVVAVAVLMAQKNESKWSS